VARTLLLATMEMDKTDHMCLIAVILLGTYFSTVQLVGLGNVLFEVLSNGLGREGC
jgi:hypothetical protein